MTNITNNNKKITNKFELCLIAGHRAKSILPGSSEDHGKFEKAPIIALKEIEEGKLDLNQIRKNIAHGENFYHDNDENIIELTPKEIKDKKASKSEKDNIFASENLIVDD